MGAVNRDGKKKKEKKMQTPGNPFFPQVFDLTTLL